MSSLKASMPLFTSGIHSPPPGSHNGPLSNYSDVRAGSPSRFTVTEYGECGGSVRVDAAGSDSPSKGGSVRVFPGHYSPPGAASVAYGALFPSWMLAARPENSIEASVNRSGSMIIPVGHEPVEAMEMEASTSRVLDPAELEEIQPPAAKVLGVIPMVKTKPTTLTSSVQSTAPSVGVQPPMIASAAGAASPPVGEATGMNERYSEAVARNMLAADVASSFQQPPTGMNERYSEAVARNLLAADVASSFQQPLMGSFRSQAPIGLTQTVETAIAPRSVPMVLPVVNTAPPYVLTAVSSPAPAAPEPTAPEPEAPPPEEPVSKAPATVQTVWDGHFDAFLRRDLARLLADYDDSSHIRLFNDADGTKIDCIGVARIAQLYGELMADLLEKQPEASVVDIDEVAGSVFFVWRCPVAGVLAATSTYIFAHTMKIWRQNMVLTKVPRSTSRSRPASLAS